MVEGWREEIKHQMARDLESLRVTIKEMEREIRRDGSRGREWDGVKTGEKEGGKRKGDKTRSVSCNFLQSKCISSETEKEKLSHSIEYIYLTDRHPPTVKQAPQLP